MSLNDAEDAGRSDRVERRPALTPPGRIPSAPATPRPAIEHASVRGAWVHVVFSRALEQLGRETLLRDLGEDCAERIIGTARVGWVSAYDQLALLDAVYRRLGRERFVSVHRAAVDELVASPLLRPMAVVGARAFGLLGLRRLFPRAWSLVLSGYGTAHVAQTEDGARSQITLSDVLREIAESAAFRASLVATLLGAIDAVLTYGDVDAELGGVREGEHAPAIGQLEFDLWVEN